MATTEVHGVRRQTGFGQQIGCVEVNTQANGDISGVRTINLQPYPPPGGGGGDVAEGSVTNSTLRWNGTAWVENTSVTADATGAVTASSVSAVSGALTVRSFDDDVVVRAENPAKTVNIEGLQFQNGLILNARQTFVQTVPAAGVLTGNTHVIPQDFGGSCATIRWQRYAFDDFWTARMTLIAKLENTSPHNFSDCVVNFSFPGFFPYVSITGGWYNNIGMSLWFPAAAVGTPPLDYLPQFIPMTDVSMEFDTFTAPFVFLQGIVLQRYVAPPTNYDYVTFYWVFRAYGEVGDS